MEHAQHLPMRLEVRLWDVDHILLFDDKSQEVVQEVAEVVRLSSLSNRTVELPPSGPTSLNRPISIELSLDDAVTAESRIHLAKPLSTKPNAVSSWDHCTLRSSPYSCALREILMLSVLPSCLEGTVCVRAFQWNRSSSHPSTSMTSKGGRSSAQGLLMSSVDPNGESMCSVSEQDETERNAQQGPTRICIGSLRLPLRSLLTGENRQIRLYLQLEKGIRKNVVNKHQDLSPLLHDALTGKDVGGIAAISMQCDAFFGECLLPYRSSLSTAASGGNDPLLSGGDDTLGVSQTARGAPSEYSVTSRGSHMSSSPDLWMALIPQRVMADCLSLVMDVLLWKQPSHSFAIFVSIVVTCWLELHAVAIFFTVVAVSLHVSRSIRSMLWTCSPRKALAIKQHASPDGSLCQLLPPRYLLLNTIERLYMWFQAGYTEEVFLEYVTIVRWYSVHAAALHVLFWVMLALWLWMPPHYGTCALYSLVVLPPVLMRGPYILPTIRRRKSAVDSPSGGAVPASKALAVKTNGLTLGPFEVLLPQPWMWQILPVTAVVKMCSRPLTQSRSPHRNNSMRISLEQQQQRSLSSPRFPPPAAATAGAQGADYQGGRPNQQNGMPHTRPNFTSPTIPTLRISNPPTNDTAVWSKDLYVSPDTVNGSSPTFRSPLHQRTRSAGATGGDLSTSPLMRRGSADRTQALSSSMRLAIPPAPPLSARARQKASDSGSSAVSAHHASGVFEPPQRMKSTPTMKRSLDSALPNVPSFGGPRNGSGSTMRQRHTMFSPNSSGWTFAVVTAEWKEDTISNVESSPGWNARGGSDTLRRSASDVVSNRIVQFYKKLASLEQRLAPERHSISSVLSDHAPYVESVGSGSSVSAGNPSPMASSSNANLIHDQVMAEASVLLLFLRRQFRGATVHVSASSLSGLDQQSGPMERLERIAPPSALIEQAPNDPVASALMAGFPQLSVSRIPTAKNCDESCRGWTLLAMSLLSGRKISWFSPPFSQTLVFIVPLQAASSSTNALPSFDAAHGTGSCPGLLLSALQDAWRGWSMERGSHALVTVDMILTIISSYRDYWKHHGSAANGGSSGGGDATNGSTLMKMFSGSASGGGGNVTPRSGAPPQISMRRGSRLPPVAVSGTTSLNASPPQNSQDHPLREDDGQWHATTNSNRPTLSPSDLGMARNETSRLTPSEDIFGPASLRTSTESHEHRHSRGVYEALGIKQSVRKEKPLEHHNSSSFGAGRALSPSHGQAT